MKAKIQLVQVNDSYGNQYFLPYSVGLLQSYCNKFDDVRENFIFMKFIYKQEIDLEQQVKNMGKRNIIAQACYIWNWQFNIEFAKLTKKYNPDALIILGGPRVPDDSTGFFDRYPYIDILCHGEGEMVFHDILKQYMSEQQYGNIEGVSYHDRKANRTVYTPRRARAIDLETIPSPYLDGTFSELLEDDVTWQASWETNRGCPYRCTFCLWGVEYYNKIRKFPFEERLLEEIRWFSINKIGLVFGCDANFGIFERDLDIANALVEFKKEYGYPQKFRVCNAKNSNARVFEISKILNGGGMDKGTSMSVQSMNENVLETVKRKNIGTDKFEDLMNRFNESSIPTYTEIILPLPNETYESFITGLDVLFHSGQHSQLNIYNCTVLTNSEMASPEFMKEHNIQTVDLPVFQAHIDNKPNEYIQELETIAVGTKTMPTSDWKKSQRYSWAVQTFHGLGLLQYIAIFFVNRYDRNYSDFYHTLLEYAQDNPRTLFGLELNEMEQTIDNILIGKMQGQLVPEYELDIVWPAEEASLLRILNTIDVFYEQCVGLIKYFIEKYELKIDDRLLADLILLQKKSMVHFNDELVIHVNLKYNLVEYIRNIKIGCPSELFKFSSSKPYKRVSNWKYPSDKNRFAREIVWYGRKGGLYIHPFNESSECRENIGS
tara:strand:- start:796 stop:2778 length:1983 start_codon:yes stop_codon:yes gene_type:complete